MASPSADSAIPVAEVISALSCALDLVEGQPKGHAVRSCVFAMHIAREIGLPPEAQSDLYYASLMKDAGCSANASTMMHILGSDDIAGKRGAVTIDWTRMGWESLQYALAHVKRGAPFLERMRALFTLAVNKRQDAKVVNQIRCDRGANIARRIGLSEASAEAIQCLNEHWNGRGMPQGLVGEQIPLLSRIMNLAQTVDVFYSAHGEAGPSAAYAIARKRSGRWFDPDLVKAYGSLARRKALWGDVENATWRVIELEPREEHLVADDERLDNICLAFADVIDAKSPFTYQHSTGVAAAAVTIARALSMSEKEVTLIRRAALLHDIGKLSVSNMILDKPVKLTPEEWDSVAKHPRYSLEILQRISSFADLSELAGSHHERLDGSGYFRGFGAERMSTSARILAVADVYDALVAKRPYRDALPIEKVFAIMGKDAPRALDRPSFEALQASVPVERPAEIPMTEGLLRLSAAVEQGSRVEDPVSI
jgi:putative nucleotidyltransferase with HDIG domain